MASTACFLNNLAALSSPAARASSQRSNAAKSCQVVCRAAQKHSAAQEDGGSTAETAAVSRRLALTVLIGAAAVGSKVSPADAAYGPPESFLSSASEMASNDQIKYKAGEAKGQTQEKLGRGADAVKGNAEGAKENTGNFFTTAKDKVSEATQATKDKVTGAGQATKDKVNGAGQATKDKTAETIQAGKDKVSGGD